MTSGRVPLPSPSNNFDFISQRQDEETKENRLQRRKHRHHGSQPSPVFPTIHVGEGRCGKAMSLT
ncbi:unnamed protein product [Periconia digitata]|uniref:Uncharacterized protein n=1 Tax=Periconia digitata TaxID=1303443 RepID=A0A9W4UGU7_9PLEO|nr:unnamed protein product [Periconia digitata]